MADHEEYPRPTAAELAAARERARAADLSEPRAASARYDAPSGRVVIELRDGCMFAFPAERGEGLRGASPGDLADIEVVPDGTGLHWPRLDADLLVAPLVAGIFGSRAWMSQMGRAGGSVRSGAKAAAARANGRKGGRPRKHAPGSAPARGRSVPMVRETASDPYGTEAGNAGPEVEVGREYVLRSGRRVEVVALPEAGERKARVRYVDTGRPGRVAVADLGEVGR